MLIVGEQVCHVSTCQKPECKAAGGCTATPKVRTESCTWTLEDDWNASIWHTTCGATWSFTEEGPEENGCHYCHRCGGALVIVRPEPRNDDESAAA